MFATLGSYRFSYQLSSSIVLEEDNNYNLSMDISSWQRFVSLTAHVPGRISRHVAPVGFRHSVKKKRREKKRQQPHNYLFMDIVSQYIPDVFNR